MTDRAEIERLLQMTGRTLKGLPDIYPDEQRQATWEEIANADEEPENRVLHQSDVIELLVGALRDALDKPMQKPLTLEELGQYEDKPVFVEVGFRRPNWDRPKITHKKWYLMEWHGRLLHSGCSR